MEHIFIANGETQLVLIPENELDKLLLEKIIDGSPIEIDWIRQPVGILGKSVKNGIIIRKKKNDTIKTKDMSRVSDSKAHLESSREG